MSDMYVYILQSDQDGRFYTGYSRDVERRLWRHNAGLVKSTRNRRPLKLVYRELCGNLAEAKSRERQLKRGKSTLQKHRLIRSLPVH